MTCLHACKQNYRAIGRWNKIHVLSQNILRTITKNNIWWICVITK